MLSRVLCAVLLTTTAACSMPSEIESNHAPHAMPAAAAPDLVVWPADGALEALSTDAAARIERATGLHVDVGDGAVGTALPLFWSPRGQTEGWLGHYHVGERADWLAIDPSTPPELLGAVALHEVLHALGAGHVSRGAGVMSPRLWARAEGWPITAADLERVCAVRDCSVFAPEAGAQP